MSSSSPLSLVPGDEGDALEQLLPIDVLLRQGTLEAQAAVWQRAANEPDAMLEMAETVALVEQLRSLQTESSATFGIRLAEVVMRAERRLAPRPSRMQGWPWGVAAAAAALLLLLLWDPLRAHPPSTCLLPPAAAGPVAAVDVPDVVPDSRVVAWQSNVETMRRRLDLEASPRLREALEAGLGGREDSLGGWLDPRNHLMRMRLDHELRGDAARRQEALRSQGGIAAADLRVQQLADALGQQLPAVVAFGEPTIESVAFAVRALIAAGPGGFDRQRALRVGGDWLATSLAAAPIAEVGSGLAALVEVSAVTGEHGEVIRQAGERLLASVLTVDVDNWSRRLPELLLARVRPGLLAETSRALASVPAFGVAAGRCAIVRQLLLGPLRERRAAGEDTPELVAAILYGSADLLAADERRRLEAMMLRWKPVHLLADLPTLQQLAWALAPGRNGFTRQQTALRQLAVGEDPLDLGKRGAFCLCLATGYAAWAGGVLPKLVGGS